MQDYSKIPKMERDDEFYSLVASICRPYCKQGLMGPTYRSQLKKRDQEMDSFFIRFDERGQPLAFMSFKRYKKSNGILLEKMATREGSTSMGIGSAFIKKLQEIAKSEGRWIGTKVSKVNERGFSFYEKMGFVHTPDEDGDIVRYYLWGEKEA